MGLDGAMVIGELPVPERPTDMDNTCSRAWAY